MSSSFAPYMAPTDSIPDYVPTPSEWSADSVSSRSALMASGDSLVIDYVSYLLSGGGGTAGKIAPPSGEQSTTQFKIYPNPTTGQLNIIADSMDPIRNIQLYDALGRTILSKNYDGSLSTQLNLQGVSKGEYIIKVQTDTTVHFEKISIY